jgi:hypothetical protein
VPRDAATPIALTALVFAVTFSTAQRAAHRSALTATTSIYSTTHVRVVSGSA